MSVVLNYSTYCILKAHAAAVYCQVVCIWLIWPIIQQHWAWCQSILLFLKKTKKTKLNYYLSVLLNIVLFVDSFMKGFKRKGHSSLLTHLKTHCKFPLIETFLETLMDSTKQVLYTVQGIIRGVGYLLLWWSGSGLVIRNHSDHSTSTEVQWICDQSESIDSFDVHVLWC